MRQLQKLWCLAVLVSVVGCASAPRPEPVYPAVGCRLFYGIWGAMQQKVLVIGSYSDSQYKVLLPGDRKEQWKPVDKIKIFFMQCWDASVWGFGRESLQEPEKEPKNR